MDIFRLYTLLEFDIQGYFKNSSQRISPTGKYLAERSQPGLRLIAIVVYCLIIILVYLSKLDGQSHEVNQFCIFPFIRYLLKRADTIVPSFSIIGTITLFYPEAPIATVRPST